MKNIKNKHLISSSQHLVSWWLTWTASKVLSNSKYKLLQVSIHWKYEKKHSLGLSTQWADFHRSSVTEKMFCASHASS